MRSKTSIGALVAASFLGQSFAQAPEYGSGSGDLAHGSEANIHGGSSGSSTCGAEKTTTVFVTVPTSSGSPSESHLSDPISGLLEHTVTRTLQSTATLFVSDGIPHSSSVPFLSAGPPPESTLTSAPSIGGSGIKPFTTITIDIWGTGSDPAHGSNKPGTGSGTDFQITASTQGISESFSDLPELTHVSDSATDAWSTISVLSETTPKTSLPDQTGEESSTLATTDAGQTSSPTAYGSSDSGTGTPGPSVVTDSDVYWTVGADGPTQITVLSSYTLTANGQSTSGPETQIPDSTLPGGRVTVTGTDGKPTIIIDASAISEGNGPAPTATESALSIPGNTLPGGRVTVTGTDGNPTVIINGGDISAPTTAEPSSAPGNTLPGGRVTITGADGNPTVIINGGEIPAPTTVEPSSVPGDTLPGGRVTITGANGNPTVIINGPSPTASEPSSVPGNTLPGERVTITGADGNPTVVINGPSPTASETFSAPENNLPGRVTITGSDGNPTVIINGGGVSGGNAPMSTTAQSSLSTLGSSLPGARTTVTGTDGKPTVMIDASHISEGDNIASTASQSAPTIPSSQIYGSGDYGFSHPHSDSTPSAVSIGNNPKTTFTVIGADGLPTVIESTLATPGSAPLTVSFPYPTYPPLPGSIGPGNSGGIPPYFPSTAASTGDVPQTTYTIIGTDGLPTVVKSPLEIPGSGSLPYPTNLPFPGLPVSGVPGGFPTNFPNSGPQGGITTHFTFTFTGANGYPTEVQSTIVLSPTDQASGGAIPTIAAPRPESSNGFPGAGGVTTCYSYTVLGPNGLPTVVDSTMVIPTAAPVTDSSPGLPTHIPSDQGAPQGLPPVAGLTSAFSYTFTGPDGNPTVLETTIIATPTNTAPRFPGGELGSPGPVITQGAFDSGVPASPSTTCTTFTFVGPDGIPTVTKSTWTIAGPVQTTSAFGGVPGVPSPLPTLAWPWPAPGASLSSLPSILPSGFPSGLASGFPSGFPPGFTSGLPSGFLSISNGQNVASTTCTSYTVLGPDGLPTVVETTWTAPGGFPQVTGGPPNGFPWNVPIVTPGAPGNPQQTGPLGVEPTLASTTYTKLGADGFPTVVETTWTALGPVATVGGIPQVTGGLPNPFPWNLPGITPAAPGNPQQPGPFGVGATTTCTTYTQLGVDGLPTVHDVTWTIPAPLQTSIGAPSVVSSIAGLPQGTSLPGPENSAVTTSFTIINIGPNGLPTPLVQTVVLTPAAGSPITGTGIPFPFTPGPVIGTAQTQAPSLSAYGPELSGFPTIGVPFPPNLPSIFSNGQAAPHTDGLPPLITGPFGGVLTGPGAAIPTPVTNPFGQSSNLGVPGAPYFPSTPGAGPPSYGSDLNDGAVRPGPPFGPPSDAFPTDATLWPSAVAYNTPSAAVTPVVSLPCTTLKTSTWVNIIPEQTTTYTLNYPLTTLATVTSPTRFGGFKNIVRRQLSDAGSPSQWSNTTTSITTPSVTIPVLTVPTLCSSGGNIGNYTLDFDDIKPGPLYNPAGDFWFSQGFSVVPPSSQMGAYSPSSGGQLIEFIPPSLSGPLNSGSGDTAEIGVGPNFAIPCYKFDIYGLDLGCAAQSSEQWCEFEIAAYAYDESSGSAQSLSWSETKRVPACPGYPTGRCNLTPVDLDGYTNVTSVLITLRVGLESRTWWADDIRVGWTDNSCDAASCRADSAFVSHKKSTRTALRQRLWNLMSSEPRRSVAGIGGNAQH